jgi:uncharacterized repeat protein (TIGR02543 family)
LVVSDTSITATTPPGAAGTASVLVTTAGGTNAANTLYTYGAPSYSVTYNGNTSTGGSVPTDGTTYANGASVTVLGNTGSLAKTGYTFGGWNTLANGTGTAQAAASTFTMGGAAVTLYARWTINSYTVTFDANTGTGTMPAQSANYNVATALTANTFTKTGYTFTGWNTFTSGTGTAFANSANFSFGGSITLYAQWTPIPAPTVTAISPSSGPTAGGTSVTISGTGFVSGITVTIGGTEATNVFFGSATSLTATTPALSAGAKDVVVTTPDTQTGTLTGGFTYATPLNDTGQTLCDNGLNVLEACSNTNTGDTSAMPRQDGRFGRDAASFTKTGGGVGGFDFTRICFNGAAEGTTSGPNTCTGTLLANTTATASGTASTDWACTKDNVTNLIWSLESGWGDWTNYAQTTLPTATNSATRCGFNTGWRLPTRRELLGIVLFGSSAPSIDESYLPTSTRDLYWTSDTTARYSDRAWFVNFADGLSFYNGKVDDLYVRLVRSGP